MFYSHVQSFAVGIVIACMTFTMFLNYKEREQKHEKNKNMIRYTKDTCINQRPTNTELTLCEYLKKKYL